MQTTGGFDKDKLRSTCLRCGGAVPFEPGNRKTDMFGNVFFRCPTCDAKNIAQKKVYEEDGFEYYEIVRVADD